MNQNQIRLYREMHQTNPHYGTWDRGPGPAVLPHIQRIVDEHNVASVLDYGCGRSDLVDRVTGPTVRHKYDPAVAGVDTPPEPRTRYSLVVCTDVVEHLDLADLDELMTIITSHTDLAAISVCVEHAANKLPDGSPCHLTVKDQGWWVDFMTQYWECVTVYAPQPRGFLALCGNRTQGEA